MAKRDDKTAQMSIPERAMHCVSLAEDADGGNRAAALEDLQFSAGEQWPADIKMARQLDRRPCLTIDKTDTFVRSVVNSMRQQRPRIKVHPVSDGADQDVAEVIEGLMRHIEVQSGADAAYDTAADFQVRMGWGFVRVGYRYVDERSFDQEIYIDRVRNPFSVYLDPSSSSPDGLDQQWAVVTDRIRKDVFIKTYPKAKLNDFKSGEGDERDQYSMSQEVMIAEFWRVEEDPDTLLQFNDGTQALASEKGAPSAKVGDQVGELLVIDARDTMRRSVKWSKVTASQELEKRDWPGKYIPIVPAYGAELIDNGKTIRYGMVRKLKDPQRMLNFWRTQEAELVALAPKAPWLVAEGQTENHEDEWASANVKNHSTLTYRAVADENGNMLPPPMRQQPQAIPAASVNAAMNASEDLKAVAGMFDPALGAPGQETSGTMVAKRQAQSDLSNFHFYDNLTRCIRGVGIISLDLIPRIYNRERVTRIIGEDGTPDSVTINEEAVDKVLNDLTVGRYDIIMDTGPGYDTKRQESSAMMIELVSRMPQLGELAGDLIVGQMDWPGARMLAERLKMANPLAQAQDQIPKDLDPKSRQMIGNLMGQLHKAQQQLQQLTQEKEAKIIGIQEKEQAITAREQLKQREETNRLHIKEVGHEERAQLASQTKIHDTNTRAAEDHFEALLDSHTDLSLGKNLHDHDRR